VDALVRRVSARTDVGFQEPSPRRARTRAIGCMKAIEYSLPLEPRQFDREVHDWGSFSCRRTTLGTR